MKVVLSTEPFFVLFWGPLIYFYSCVCVCHPVPQARTPLKLAPPSSLEQHNLSGEWQKVRAGLGRGLGACWGRIGSGAGKMKA